MSFPMPKFLGRFSNKGLAALATLFFWTPFLATPTAAAFRAAGVIGAAFFCCCCPFFAFAFTL